MFHQVVSSSNNNMIIIMKKRSYYADIIKIPIGNLDAIPSKVHDLVVISLNNKRIFACV